MRIPREQLDSTMGKFFKKLTKIIDDNVGGLAEAFYTAALMPIGGLVFLASWAYCTVTYGFLLGFGLGWLPSIFLAFLLAIFCPYLVIFLGPLILIIWLGPHR